MKLRYLFIAALVFLIAVVFHWRRTGRALPLPPAAFAPPFPRGIVLHHSSSRQMIRGKTVDATMIDQWHENRGFARWDGERVYHIGYHFVIAYDGSISRGRPETLRGAHARYANDCLGICIVGDFDSKSNRSGRRGSLEPTASQMRSLASLLGYLLKKYNLTADQIYRHSDVSDTDCPGNRFPFEELKWSAATWLAQQPPDEVKPPPQENRSPIRIAAGIGMLALLGMIVWTRRQKFHGGLRHERKFATVIRTSASRHAHRTGGKGAGGTGQRRDVESRNRVSANDPRRGK